MVPATQRTNNTPGFALQQTSWTDLSLDGTEDAVYVNITLLTPVLNVGNVIQMYASFGLPAAEVISADNTAQKKYDTVACSVEYHGSENFNYYKYEVHDYSSIDLFHDITTGTFLSSIADKLDTANEGTEDWVIDEKNSKNVCY